MNDHIHTKAEMLLPHAFRLRIYRYQSPLADQKTFIRFHIDEWVRPRGLGQASWQPKRESWVPDEGQGQDFIEAHATQFVLKLLDDRQMNPRRPLPPMSEPHVDH